MSVRKLFFIRISIISTIVLAFMIAIHFQFLSYREHMANHLISPVAQAAENTKNILGVVATKKSLHDVIQTVLPDATNYGVYIKNLSTGETYTVNEHTTYDTASLYKLWIMAETYRQIQEGILKEDQVLSQDVPTLNQEFQIASESAELQDGTVTESVDDALEKMITVSDNYSALLLSEKIRLSNVQLFLTQNGLKESSVGITGGTPKTTASDIALFLEKLYNGQFANKEYTDKMIALLKRQQVNTKLPKYLPDNVEMAHKTGELGALSHDAGIVYTPNGNYIIAVLSNTNYPPVAVEQIAQISSAAYTYFVNE